jgi:hypothetical protein
MRNLLFQLYWTAIILLILVVGVIGLDKASAGNLIRDLSWPDEQQIDCS